jgi:hypothetical protein
MLVDVYHRFEGTSCFQLNSLKTEAVGSTQNVSTHLPNRTAFILQKILPSGVFSRLQVGSVRRVRQPLHGSDQQNHRLIIQNLVRFGRNFTLDLETCIVYSGFYLIDYLTFSPDTHRQYI